MALDILDDIDPDPEASMTHIECMLEKLGVRVREVNLGEQGPEELRLRVAKCGRQFWSIWMI